MMGAKAREMLLSGDKNAGLASYKSRMYRKMDADDGEKACPPLAHCKNKRVSPYRDCSTARDRVPWHCVPILLRLCKRHSS